MKKSLLSYEIGRKYEKTVALFKSKDDGKPLFSTTVSGDYRIPVGRLLIGAAISLGVAAILLLAAAPPEKNRKKN